jgi:hypothetical protein
MAMRELPCVMVRNAPGDSLDVTATVAQEKLDVGQMAQVAIPIKDTEQALALPLGVTEVTITTQAGVLSYGSQPGGPYFSIGAGAAVTFTALKTDVTHTIYYRSSKDNDTLHYWTRSP